MSCEHVNIRAEEGTGYDSAGEADRSDEVVIVCVDCGWPMAVGLVPVVEFPLGALESAGKIIAAMQNDLARRRLS